MSRLIWIILVEGLMRIILNSDQQYRIICHLRIFLFLALALRWSFYPTEQNLLSKFDSEHLGEHLCEINLNLGQQCMKQMLFNEKNDFHNLAGV